MPNFSNENGVRTGANFALFRLLGIFSLNYINHNEILKNLVSGILKVHVGLLVDRCALVLACVL